MVKRAILTVSASLIMFAATGCAARVGYYGGYANVPPPPPPREVIGIAPGPGFVWVGGYYGWRPNGGYYWTPGRWARPPRPRARWQSGRWQHTRRGYVWRDGRWR